MVKPTTGQPDKLPHQQADEFRAALEYTQSTTGFRASLVEKDYYCSLALQYLFDGQDHDLVFKGGTCLNKVHMGFFRLSEDLDFTIPTAVNATRNWRRRAIEPVKQLIAAMATSCPHFQITALLTGANNSTQYLAEIIYQSVLSRDLGRIKIDVGLRDDMLLPAEQRDAITLLKSPFSGKAVFPTVRVTCLPLAEALAEKVRAMLTRREIAIRDFFDFWHARKAGAITTDSDFLALVHKKLAVSVDSVVPLGQEQIEVLKRQVETDLRPVLSEEGYAGFPFGEALAEARAILVAIDVHRKPEK